MCGTCVYVCLRDCQFERIYKWYVHCWIQNLTEEITVSFRVTILLFDKRIQPNTYSVFTLLFINITRKLLSLYYDKIFCLSIISMPLAKPRYSQSKFQICRHRRVVVKSSLNDCLLNASISAGIRFRSSS